MLLRPRHGVIEPAPVRTESYFSAAEIERARDYRRPQLALYGAVLLDRARRARAVRRAPAAAPARAVPAPGAGRRGGRRGAVDRRLGRGPAVAGRSRASARRTSASSRSRGPATRATSRSHGGSARSSPGSAAAAAVGLVRRYPRGWWVPGTVIVVAFGVVTIYAGPVVLDPLFNTFQTLPAGQTRDDVLELAERAGVDVGEVFTVDASRRTTAANAYVTGLGTTKRVVLYDTLLENFTRDEVRLVVAHELSHVHYRDVPNGLLYLAIVAPFGLFAVARLTRPPGAGGERAGPGAAARARARPRRHDDDDHDDLQPAQPPRRGARGLLRADADRRARAVHLLREADRAAQPLRSRPAGLADVRCWRRTRRRSSGSGSASPTSAARARRVMAAQP